MNDRRSLALAITLGHIHNICVTIPRKARCGGRMIPAEINAANLHPMLGNLKRRAPNQVLLNREDATRAKRRNAFGASLTLMRRIAGNNFFPLFSRVMLRIVNGHRNRCAVLAFLQEVTSHNRRHALERRKGHSDQPARGVRSRDTLEINILRRLFIEPHIVNRVRLPLAPALFVSLEQKR